MPTGKRLAIELASSRQLLRRGDGRSKVVWIDTTTQLADALTKETDFGFLSRVMQENVYDSAPSAEAKQDKLRKAELRRKRKAEGGSATVQKRPATEATEPDQEDDHWDIVW